MVLSNDLGICVNSPASWVVSSNFSNSLITFSSLNETLPCSSLCLFKNPSLSFPNALESSSILKPSLVMFNARSKSS